MINPEMEFEVKMSKTGLPVPVIEGIHLHSIYSPIKEAQSFTEQQSPNLKKNNWVLIFGLGFAYHIKQIQSELHRIYSGDYKIFVIEPNRKLVDYCVKNDLIEISKNLNIFCYREIKNYFSDKTLVDFLCKKPVVIPHTSSFNLNAHFFKSFMTYKEPTSLQQISHHIQDEEIRNYILNDQSDMLFDDYLLNLKKKRVLEKDDYFLMMFSELVNETHSIAGKESEGGLHE